MTRLLVASLSGKSAGFWMISSFPLDQRTLKGTVGGVIMMLAPCSCRRRSSKTEQWSVPRKPSLQPAPRASEFSFIKVTLRSLRTI